eukprot:scaffold25830_cov101-Isochrysis_galbana.AAC.6
MRATRRPGGAWGAVAWKEGAESAGVRLPPPARDGALRFYVCDGAGVKHETHTRIHVHSLCVKRHYDGDPAAGGHHAAPAAEPALRQRAAAAAAAPSGRRIAAVAARQFPGPGQPRHPAGEGPVRRAAAPGLEHAWGCAAGRPAAGAGRGAGATGHPCRVQGPQRRRGLDALPPPGAGWRAAVLCRHRKGGQGHAEREPRGRWGQVCCAGVDARPLLPGPVPLAGARGLHGRSSTRRSGRPPRLDAPAASIRGPNRKGDRGQNARRRRGRGLGRSLG